MLLLQPFAIGLDERNINSKCHPPNLAFYRCQNLSNQALIKLRVQKSEVGADPNHGHVRISVIRAGLPYRDLGELGASLPPARPLLHDILLCVSGRAQSLDGFSRGLCTALLK